LTFAPYDLYFGVKKGRRSGFAALSLIISLLVVALTVFLVISYLLRQQDKTPEGIDSPIQRARNVQCLAQIKNIELQVQLYSVQNGRYPDNLEMLEDLAAPDLRCPITQSYYQYDPQSGRVSCPDHIR
jgi:competence protein ComGC